MDFHRIARNSSWNLLGQVTPLAAAFLCIPSILRGMGDARFGVLTLAWMIVGYFSFFDLGLGRALTHVLSIQGTSKKQSDPGHTIGPALLVLAGLGAAGGLVMALVAPWLVHRVLRLPPDLVTETEWALRVIGVTVPFVTLTSGLRGVVEARQMFRDLNLLRIPVGLLGYVGPWIVVQFSPKLEATMVVLLGVRVVGAVAHAWLARRAFPNACLRWRVRIPELRALLVSGGWMTVSNVIGPIMVNMDRFVLGAMVSVTAVAFYATPYEIVTRLLTVSAAVSAALFPSFSSAQDPKEFAQARQSYGRAIVLLFAILGPGVLAIIVGAQWGLSRWLSPDFALESAPVLRILAVGVLLNSLATVPFTWIQAAGMPRITALVHILELPLYLVLLWTLVRVDGIRGAAIAWTARVALDAAILAWIARRLMSTTEDGASRAT